MPEVVSLKHPDVFIAAMIALREQRGFEPEQIADRLGVAHYAFNDWEKGKRRPRIAIAIRWAATLGAELSLAASL